MAYRTRWTRRRLLVGPLLGLTAALAAAGCSSGAAPASRDNASGRPALTQAQARNVLDAYVAASAKAARTGEAALALSVVTGVQRSVLAAALGSHRVVIKGAPSSPAHRSTLTIAPDPFGRGSYRSPVFYLPQRAGYPRFFVAAVTRTAGAAGASPASSATVGAAAATVIGGASVPAQGPALMLFEQASTSAPWLLASVSRLAAGTALPRLATDSAGYTPTVRLTSGALVARPADVGALQAAVVDDGPASAAARAVASGPLTTGMYAGARDHADGLRAPRGDVYQWELDGSSLPQFALRTADGGALVFYAMSLDTTVTVPGVIDKADPVRSGPPISVPASLLMLLPTSRPAPLVQLQSQQSLSFAAVDPAPGGSARVQVIAVGGGLASASAD